MNKKTVAAWVKKIEAERARVAKTRDHLDETIGEMEGLRDSCERAAELLQDARDALSELA